MIPKGKMRLYRGLTRKYLPEKVGEKNGPMAGTDFTDCPVNTAENTLQEWIGDRKTGKKRSFPRSFIEKHVPEWRGLFDRILQT